MTAFVFVVPALGGHASGGTRYNAALVRELHARGVDLVAVDPSELDRHCVAGGTRWVIIDSLYLAQHAELAERARSLGARFVGLLAHYLPSLVHTGDSLIDQLDECEARAVATSDAVIVTSEFMREVLVRCGLAASRCCVLEPGCELERAVSLPSAAVGLRALLVAHVVPGKGILELLTSLSSRLSPSDSFTLDIAGELGVDTAYAESCVRLVQREAALRQRVDFLGCLSPAELCAAFVRHHVCVSASWMEAYGMALAEARTLGVPILARAGGNVEHHVRSEWGGELTADAAGLAAACVRLARDPGELERRRLAAWKHAVPPRAWSRVAAEFEAALVALEAAVSRANRNNRTSGRTTT
ncbi:MAG: glycosyltransferase [Myxococcota bacterium]